MGDAEGGEVRIRRRVASKAGWTGLISSYVGDDKLKEKRKGEKEACELEEGRWRRPRGTDDREMDKSSLRF